MSGHQRLQRRVLARTKEGALPSQDEIESELYRVRYRANFRQELSHTVFLLVVVAAVAILVAVLLLPVLRIYGSSMNDTLNEGDIVVSIKGNDLSTGDIIAFYYNNKILVKRVIGTPGDWIDLDKALGDCNIELPYQVPESRVFVMGDNRSVSVDSRNTAVGCVAEEQIVGKIVFRVWPVDTFGQIG